MLAVVQSYKHNGLRTTGGHSALLLQPHVLRLEATLQLPAVLQDGAQEQVADGTAEQQQAALAQLATQWVRVLPLSPHC